MNSKVKYLSLTLPINILFMLLVFNGFNSSYTIWHCVHNHYYYCTSGCECWFGLWMELYVLSRRHD